MPSEVGDPPTTTNEALDSMGGLRRATDGRPRRLGCLWKETSVGGRSGGWRWTTTAAGGDKGRRIAVIGGGLTGLTTAYRLAKQQPRSTKITLYEASSRLGGWIQTDYAEVDVGGVRGRISLERGARTMSSLHTSTWRFDDLALYDLANDLGLEIVSPQDAPRFILHADQKLEALPTTAWQMVRSRTVRKCLWAGPGYALRRLLTARGSGSVPSEDVSVAEWIRKVTMSRAVVDTASALMHGVYGGDVEQLSARTVLGAMYWRYHLPSPPSGHVLMPKAESVFLRQLSADAAVRSLALGCKGALLHFGTLGMEGLVRALEEALRERVNVVVRTGCSVEGIRYNAESSTVTVRTASSSSSSSSPPSSPPTPSSSSPSPSSSTYDKVIATVPPSTLSRLTSPSLPSLLPFESVSVMTVTLWYPRRQPHKPARGFGYLIPRGVPNPELALGVFFDSDVSVVGPGEPCSSHPPHQEQQGTTTTKLFVLLGGHHYNRGRLDDDDGPPSETRAVQQAKSVVHRHLAIPLDEPCFAQARFATDCIPQPLTGHEARLARADDELRSLFQGSLVVAGGFYSRVGALAAIRAGYDTAARLASDDDDDDRLYTGIETGLECVEVAERDITVRNLASQRGGDK
ncbi:hypothetical protein L249_7297 [Ophiocordyceps polyrhachis-furcata BCC 54312]|uniref:Protoporphyrinogen oxidase n=1 Tax=Ophiocordyceps polyrhachis-furcata BCC 54312 TaxID=1330021 RepID=A0A367LAP5_9HYPO|nr:hypothetical protein L249_7297 [Ophiocordyceps polyrhachis-furcata BCC 54312]